MAPSTATAPNQIVPDQNDSFLVEFECGFRPLGDPLGTFFPDFPACHGRFFGPLVGTTPVK